MKVSFSNQTSYLIYATIVKLFLIIQNSFVTVKLSWTNFLILSKKYFPVLVSDMMSFVPTCKVDDMEGKNIELVEMKFFHINPFKCSRMNFEKISYIILFTIISICSIRVNSWINSILYSNHFYYMAWKTSAYFIDVQILFYDICCYCNVRKGFTIFCCISQTKAIKKTHHEKITSVV